MTPVDFGLESLYKLQPITSKQDALILLVHFVLSKNGWQYVGRGDTWQEDETPSESLPRGWADNADPYRYVSRADAPKKFTIKFIVHDKFLLVNMVSVNEESTVSMNINMSQEVVESELASNVPKRVYPNLVTLIGNIHDQLVVPCEVSSRSIGTQSTNTQSSQNAPPRRPHDPGYPPERHPSLREDPRLPEAGVLPLGRRDLDPFAPPGVGGGMIFDPLRVDRRHDPLRPVGPDGLPLPRGAVPPGARFDPFGGDPDPDHFMPPGMGRRGGGGRFGGGFGGGGFGGGFI